MNNIEIDHVCFWIAAMVFLLLLSLVVLVVVVAMAVAMAVGGVLCVWCMCACVRAWCVHTCVPISRECALQVWDG